MPLQEYLNKINANVLCFYLWFKLYAIEAKYNWAIPEKKTNTVGLRTYFFETFFTFLLYPGNSRQKEAPIGSLTKLC